MAEQLNISAGNKRDKYETLIPQIQSVISDEDDLIANMANISAMLQQTFHFLWTGFYRVMPAANGDELVLGPFQGPLACTRIKYGRGVCGTAWQLGETLVVPDVDQFPGHIACSSLSKSEIVVPIKHDGIVIAVLDIDSPDLNTFDATDRHYLELISSLF